MLVANIETFTGHGTCQSSSTCHSNDKARIAHLRVDARKYNSVSRALSDPLEALFRATPRVSVQKSYEEQVQVKHFCFACCQA